MLAFLFKEGYASIVLINDTQYGAPYSSPKGGGSSTSGGEQSSESSNPQSSSTANDDETSPSTSNNEPQYTSGDETTSEDGDSTDNETYDDCLSTYNWDDCAGEFSTSCLTHQTSGISVSNDKYCTCSTNGENLAICDGTVFANHSLFDFSNYARVQGFAFDFDNMTPVSGYSITDWNYYYNKNPAGFCPYLLHVKMHDSGIWQPEIGLFALSSDYYNNTSDSMNCTSSSIIRFIGDENSGIDCVKPGFDNITRETDVNI